MFEVFHEHEQQKQSNEPDNCTFHSVVGFLRWCMFISYKNSRALDLRKEKQISAI